MKLALFEKTRRAVSKLSVTGKIMIGFTAAFVPVVIAYALAYWEISDQATVQAKGFIVLFGLISFAVAPGIALLLARSFSRPLKSFSIAAEQLAKGDLTVRKLPEDREDEFGRLAMSLNYMVFRMLELMTQVNRTVNLVVDSSEQLNAGLGRTGESTERAAMQMQEVAISSERQVADLEASRITITEMSGGIQQIAASVQEVSYSANEASELSGEGTRAIESAVSQMEAISRTFEELSAVIEGLGHRSEQIGNILKVITDISAQTNLLALNAAIEAARAGEQGRGFAVVAAEVRKLAEQSADSAKQIADIILGIQHETEKAVSTMELSSREVMEGMSVIHEAGESFSRIHRAVASVADSSQEVAAAVEELSAGSEQIVSAIGSIAELAEASLTRTQDAAASSDEQLAAMEEIQGSSARLMKIAAELRSEFSRFKM